MDTLYIVVPAYNESANIRQLVEDWYPVVQAHDGGGKSRLVVINDGSKDNTYELLKQMSKGRPFLEPVTKPNGGHGPTVLYGYRYALKHGADYIFQTDSDGQTLPQEFESFWRMRGEYDAIFGKRPHRKDGFARKVVERVLCTLLFFIYGVRIPDSNAPFRLMKKSFLAKYVPVMETDYNLPNVMLTVFAASFRDRHTFREITFRPRQGGKNSINMKKIFKIGWKALGDFRHYRKVIRQMKAEAKASKRK